MKRALAAIAALALAACAVPAPQVEVRTKTQEVFVPTPVPCFEEKDRPPLPVYTFRTQEEVDKATPKQLAEAVRADRLADQLYSDAVDALFVKCMKAQGKEVK